MGNHLFRPHLSKLATAVKYAQVNKKAQQRKNKKPLTISRNSLYSLSNKNFFLSYSNYKTSGKLTIIKLSFIVYHDSCKLIKSSDSELYGYLLPVTLNKIFKLQCFTM